MTGPTTRAALACALAGALAGGTSAAQADVQAGRTKARICTVCHGEFGVSTAPNTPNLAGQPALYVADQLRQFRSGKRASEVMAVIAKPLTDADIENLAAWFEAIRIEARPPS
jgi:cytochrome c553